MTRIVIDARLAGHSGIGVYLEHLLPRALPALARWRPLILASPAMKPLLAERLGTSGEIRDWGVPPLGASDLWNVPPDAGPRDLVWTPHFNVPLLRRGPSAVTLHDLLPIAMPRLAGTFRSLPARCWLEAIRHRARVVFCVSEFTRGEAIARTALDPKRLIVTQLGVEAPWNAEPVMDAHAPSEAVAAAPTIVSVGLMKRHKNLGRLIQAFDRVRSQIPHRLVLIARRSGLRSSDPEVMPLVHALGDRIELIDHLPLADLVARTRSAQFAVLPSLYEGFGLPALESMAIGTPLLAARAGALPEVCGDAVAYCDPESVDDIARGLLMLAFDTALRARLSAAGIVRAQQFTWDRCAAITSAALNAELEMLAASPPR